MLCRYFVVRRERGNPGKGRFIVVVNNYIEKYAPAYYPSDCVAADIVSV